MTIILRRGTFCKMIPYQFIDSVGSQHYSKQRTPCQPSTFLMCNHHSSAFSPFLRHLRVRPLPQQRLIEHTVAITRRWCGELLACFERGLVVNVHCVVVCWVGLLTFCLLVKKRSFRKMSFTKGLADFSSFVHGV